MSAKLPQPRPDGAVRPKAPAGPPKASGHEERKAFDDWCVRNGRTLGYLGWREDFKVWLGRAELGGPP